MADGRRRRGTEKHVGVVLKRRTLPSGATSWRAKLTDPDPPHAVKYETLPEAAQATEKTRMAWAVKRADALHERAKALEGGAAPKTGRELAEVVAHYYKENGPGRDEQGNVMLDAEGNLAKEGRISLGTDIAYRQGTDSFLAFAAEHRILLADELRAPHLEAFRTWLFKRPRQKQAKGGKRGGRVASDAKLSVAGVNSRMRSVKTVLDAVRRLGLVPMLTHDHIRDGLRAEREPRPLPQYLKSQQVRALLKASILHDAERFDLTREERASGAEGRQTPKHDPVAPFVAFVLLTGMRFDEARIVRWEDIDLAAPPAGTIHVGTWSKTGHARLVDLVVSPVLGRLLKVLKLRAGDAPFVFGGAEPVTRSVLEKTRKRLKREHGAPEDWTWQHLRATCGTYLANSAGIFGGASAYREARQLGHSVAVAERHYLGVVHVPHEAKTLEDAMGVKDLLSLVARAASGETVKLPKEVAAS